MSISSLFDQDHIVQTWYQALCFFSVLNIIAYMRILYLPYRSTSPSQAKYEYWIRWLALPYVFQCAYRSFWPMQYNSRVVFWATILNSCFIGRMLATVAEVTWIIQVRMGVVQALKDIRSYLPEEALSKNTQWWILLATLLSVILCTVAEFFANHALFT